MHRKEQCCVCVCVCVCVYVVLISDLKKSLSIILRSVYDVPNILLLLILYRHHTHTHTHAHTHTRIIHIKTHINAG